MTALGMAVKEVGHRWGTSLLAALVVAAAAGVAVALQMLFTATNREAKRVTRDVGFNLRILPPGTDLLDYEERGYAAGSMPEAVLEKLQTNDKLSYNHLVATLHGGVTVGGRRVIVTGLAPEYCPPGQKKPAMSFAPKAGTAEVGRLAAEALNLERDDPLTLNGKAFRVVRVNPQVGGRDDFRVTLRLSDAQAVLNLPGKINEIQAIDCLCKTPDESPGQILADEIKRRLPGTVIRFAAKRAEGRARVRRLTEGVRDIGLTLGLVVGVVGVGGLAAANVRARAAEVGLLRALGYTGGWIGGLFLARAVLIGAFGAAIGFVLGTGVVLQVGPEVFAKTAGKLAVDWNLLTYSVVAAPALAAAASLLPAVWAATQDPAAALRHE